MARDLWTRVAFRLWSRWSINWVERNGCLGDRRSTAAACLRLLQCHLRVNPHQLALPLGTQRRTLLRIHEQGRRHRKAFSICNFWRVSAERNRRIDGGRHICSFAYVDPTNLRHARFPTSGRPRPARATFLSVDILCPERTIALGDEVRPLSARLVLGRHVPPPVRPSTARPSAAPPCPHHSPLRPL